MTQQITKEEVMNLRGVKGKGGGGWGEEGGGGMT